MNNEIYNQRGVSSAKEDVHKAISNINKGLFPKAFCKILPDIAGNQELCSIMHADGAGTKSSLAYIYWKETGDLSVWKGIAQDAIIMNTDDLMCVGAVNNLVISSSIGRNKFRIPGEVIQAIIEGSEEVLDFLNSLGINIKSAGGETADVGDLVNTLIVDATVFVNLPQNEVITNKKINSNSVIVGFASNGLASYEKEYNSGMGSNGLTSARHDIFSSIYRQKYPESYDSQVNPNLIYAGSHLLTDIIPEHNMTVGKFVLSPTRTYLPLVIEIFKQMKENVHGMVHCTGGGQTKCMHFIDNLHIVKDNLFPTPLLFEKIQKASQTEWHEMYKTFNMGHRLEIYADLKSAEEMIQIAKSFNIEAQIIGHCENSESKKLSLKTVYGDFKY